MFGNSFPFYIKYIKYPKQNPGLILIIDYRSIHFLGFQMVPARYMGNWITINPYPNLEAGLGAPARSGWSSSNRDRVPAATPRRQPYGTMVILGRHQLIPCGGFLKWGYPQSSIFLFFCFCFHFLKNKPSILGYPVLGNHHVKKKKHTLPKLISPKSWDKPGLRVTPKRWGC